MHSPEAKNDWRKLSLPAWPARAQKIEGDEEVLPATPEREARVRSCALQFLLLAFFTIFSSEGGHRGGAGGQGPGVERD